MNLNLKSSHAHQKNFGQFSIERSSICAVVVTYYPDAELPMRIKQTARQADKVVIVDNGSSTACLRMLQGPCSGQAIHLIANTRNLGIATAFNQGIEYASSRGYDWVLTLDQDSIPADTMVNELIAVHNQFTDKDRIGIIGANPIDRVTGASPYTDECRHRLWVEQKAVVTSGCLMPLAPYHHIGRFRDDFFMDGVDQEYCLRLRRNGYLVIIACRAVLLHSLGKPKVHRFMWGQLIATNHPPVRRYYITRNGLVIAKKSLFSDPAWVARHLLALVKLTVRIALLENDRAANLKNIAIGVWHAIIGKMGPYHGGWDSFLGD